MARHRLTNDDWGLESNCFVCEATNPGGLQLEVFADPEAGLVDTAFELSDTHSGAPMVVHGGVSLAILDEVQAWAVIALAGQWAVTVDTQATFHQAVWVGQPYTATAEITGTEGDRVVTAGRIVDGAGATCVTSTTTLQTIGEATARAWAGADVSNHRSYLRSTEADAEPEPESKPDDA